ncbi:MAG: histidine kinase, partial [Alphaproteobacteria bacterium]|nr:histidine kinase [Alphaproteobacteria bacterium]
YSGKDKDGDETKISVSVLVVNPTTILVLTYWGSESGERKHGATLDAILKSIKRTN